MSRGDLKRLQKTIGLSFDREELLQMALTHKSHVNECESRRLKDNERLEFLGDAILELVISEYLYRQYPRSPEGQLAKMKGIVVSAPVLAEKSRELKLGDYLFLGRGEDLTGGRRRASILADVFEALIGALYLDQGLEVTREFILQYLGEDVRSAYRGNHIQDYKTGLQELVQARTGELPLYQTVKEDGPDHQKEFTVQVILDERVMGEGRGSTKKEAEQEAAREAFMKLLSS